jgi:glycogen debranching enzyme
VRPVVREGIAPALGEALADGTYTAPGEFEKAGWVVAGPWAPESEPARLGSSDSIVTLVEGSAFAVSGRSGDFHADHPEGLFFLDTRFLSQMVLSVNGVLPEPLAVLPREPFATTFVQRTPPTPGRADAAVVVLRHRYVGQGMREDVVLRNHGTQTVRLTVELVLGVDFADLFDVKEGQVRIRGEQRLEFSGDTFSFAYRRDGVSRGCRIRFSEPPLSGPQVAMWEVDLPAEGQWILGLEVSPVVDGAVISPRHRLGEPVDEAVPKERLTHWRRSVPSVDSDWQPLASATRQAAEDLGVLRIFDPDHRERTVIAAGAPWFMTLFGRDSLLTAWMALLVDPALALGVLRTLAERQGEDVHAATEEEPGKILHEVRFGSAGSLALGGGDAYYGTADATPLFVMLLGELSRWGLASDEVHDLLPHADRAIGWIEEFGDRDGDGYVEYERSTEHGLEHQGWKDSWDSTRFSDGTFAEAPIALCEVQAYAYAAYVARAHLATDAGDATLAARMTEKAVELKRRFNTDFWLEDRGWFAMALDRDKRPVDALASNMGHCLWTGIVDEDKAGRIADHLLSEEMFSGWGVRTLATSMRAYNPISYHNGSVWPHDCAIVAAGLMRYGFVEHAHRIAVGLLEGAEHSNGRLPELFCGFPRSELAAPVPYPTSCSPQAWAAASPLLLVRTLLRLDPWIPHGKLWLDPVLPPQIRELTVRGIPLGHGRITVHVDSAGVQVEGLEPGIDLIEEPRRPISAYLAEPNS